MFVRRGGWDDVALLAMHALVSRVPADDPRTRWTVQEYYDAVSGNVPLRYGSLSAFVLVFWDWVTTLDDEVYSLDTLIRLACLAEASSLLVRLLLSGSTRESGLSGRSLYFFIRYAGTAFQLYDLISCLFRWEGIQYCRVHVALLPVGTLVFLYAADLLLAYRALCLWRMKPSLLAISSAIFLLSFIFSMVTLVISISHFIYVPTPEYLTGCWVWSPDYYFLSPLPGLAFEFWLFSLVIWKAISYSRRNGSALGRPGILQLLIRDSLWWFFIISALMVLNAVFFAVGPDAWATFFLPFFRSFVIVFGCRLITHMRKASKEAQGPEMQWQMTTRVRHLTDDDAQTEAESQRIQKALNVAQRIGLPPPLAQDLVGMWYDPVATINHNTAATSAMELSAIQSEPWSPYDDIESQTAGTVVGRLKVDGGERGGFDDKRKRDVKRKASHLTWDDDGTSFEVRCVYTDATTLEEESDLDYTSSPSRRKH
ncbi:hypothetical protein FRB99_003744 [Tulasnella sp. 403]|nr:hypothetical protein FRB99_003744 [Tulasnella sp. 403]